LTIAKKGKRIRCSEGQCIAVPLTNECFARLVVSRLTSTGYLLSYCYAPSLADFPTMADFVALVPSEAVCVWRISNVGVVDGLWPVVGTMPNWNRAQWPVPKFPFTDPLTGRKYLRTFDDNDPRRRIAQERVDDDYVFPEEDDSARGHLIAVKVLSRKICEWEERNL
jgi:hypothetical protein